MSLGRRLADRAGSDLSATELAAIDLVLESAIAAARARWPGVDTAIADFVETIAVRVEGEPSLAIAVGRLALADLYLVAGCLHGDRSAEAALEQLVRGEAARAVAPGGDSAAVEDLVQELLVKLLVNGKLAAFGGHGALQAWLRVAAMRTAISLGRRRREVAVDDDALLAIADDRDDQALAFMKASYRGEFKRAFAAALGELAPRARTLLRLQIIDQLTLEEIAAFYRVSRATTARWLADARAQLVEQTRARVVEALGIDAAELAELMRMVASTLYSTLPRLLAGSST